MTQTPTSGPVPDDSVPAVDAEQTEAPAVPDEVEAAAPETVTEDAPPVDAQEVAPDDDSAPVAERRRRTARGRGRRDRRR